MKLVGRVTNVDFTAFRYCSECEATAKKREDSWWCPNCGFIDWKKTRRRYQISIVLDIFGTQVTCIARNHVMDQFLVPIGLSLRGIGDELAQFRGNAWTIRFREMKEEIDQRLWEEYGEQVIKLHTELSDGNAYVITRYKSISLKGGKAFIEGTKRELLDVTRSVLGDYEEKLELWEDIPILRYTKNVEGETVVIGIRAPVSEYGKAYRVWVRVNGVHMIPTTPVYVGGPHRLPAYVYRIYHTKGWKENLTKKLEYCVSEENFLANVVKASKTIYEEGENLWDIVNRISRYDQEKAIRILQEHGLLRNEL